LQDVLQVSFVQINDEIFEKSATLSAIMDFLIIFQKKFHNISKVKFICFTKVYSFPRLTSTDFGQ